MTMKLTKIERSGAGKWLGAVLGLCLLTSMPGWKASGQAVSTTTVQGTVYLANGQPGAGTIDVSWPAFATASNQAVAAGRVTATVASDGFMSVNLAPNLGATPAGLYYTAVYHMSDGTMSTEYWVVPAAAQASLGQVRAQVMPAAQAVQTVSKAYVDQAIAELTGSLLTASGGSLSGPLYLNGDPTQALQAADKHYVDTTFSKAVPLSGGNMTGPLATPALNGVQSPLAGSGQKTLQAAVTAAGSSGAVEIPPSYTGTDGFTNPNGVYVSDLRQNSSQQFERSVKEFGAACDGATDDTNALQTAIDYAQIHAVALTLPQGICKTHTLTWHGESIGGSGKQVSALLGFPGQDVLLGMGDTPGFQANTRLHDLTIYVDQSLDMSCSAAKGRAPAGSCQLNRPIEVNSIFSPGGNGLNGTTGTGAGWSVGNCAIAMPANTGLGGNGLDVAIIENVAVATTGADPMAQYSGAHSTHTCGMYLAQWPKWTEFRNIDIRGINTGIAMPALSGTSPAGLNADSNRWQNITLEATHGFTAAAGSNNSLDDVVVEAVNSSAAGEPPTGIVLDFGASQQGWIVRNAVVLPTWNAVQPQLTVTASGGAVTAVTSGSEHGLGFDPYGTQVPLRFSGSCSAQAQANVNSDGSIGAISVTQGGVGCSGTTTASVNATGTWDTAAPVNLISGQNMALLSGNLLKGNGGYTVWSAASSQSLGAKWGGGGTLPNGGSYPALVATSGMGSANQVDQFPGADFGAKLQACLSTLSAVNGGTCDARNFTGTVAMGSNLTLSTANATVLLPCATISTASQIIVTAGTRNVSLRGCALRGASTASGSQGGTAFLYSGAGAMVQVGDPTYTTDTNGFHMDNVAINTTASTSAAAQGLTAYRTQEMDVESLYFLGDQNQTGMTLDGTGNYTGGTFLDNEFTGFQTAVHAIGHQISNPATTDWMNASAFVRLHINCPTSSGNPISGTYGINLQQGDGNTFTGGDVEGCATALHLGANAQNNTIIGLRNENSNSQVVADAGSSYNNWITGGTMFTGELTDNGTRNSFLDSFHRSFNGMNGDWYGSQQDATVTNHYRLGIGSGNERGLLSRYQTDYGYRWTEGFSDAAAGEQFYQVLDELNNVYRLSIGQYNHGQSSTNNQTVINAAGTGAVVVNGSANSGTGGVVFGAGGANGATVATINSAGDAQFNGTLQVGGTSTFTGSTTVRNQADAEIDEFLWAGATMPQKESLIYKDYNGNSQWYMVKDASNNWALNSATGALDSFKAYQSTNGGDTYIDAINTGGVVRVNYEPGSGSAFNIYGGGSTPPLYASFTGTTSIKFPGLAASTGRNCLQIDNSGYITNTGASCGTGAGGSGTVSNGILGQIAYYTATGAQVGGMNSVPLTAGGTGASTAAGALANLGALPLAGGTLTGAIIGTAATFSGSVAAGTNVTSPYVNNVVYADGFKTGSSSCGILEAQNALLASSVGIGTIILPYGTCTISVSIPLVNGMVYQGYGAGSYNGSPAASTIQSSTGDIFVISGSTSGFRVHDVQLVSNTGGGHIFNFSNQNVDRATIDHVVAIQNNPAKSILYSVGNNSTNFIGSWIHDFDFAHPNNTIPTIYVSNITNNQLHIYDGRMTQGLNSTTYGIWLESTSAGAISTGNQVDNVTFELAAGGAVNMLGQYASSIAHTTSYDLAGQTFTLANPIFHVGTGSGGLISRDVSLDWLSSSTGGHTSATMPDVGIDTASKGVKVSNTYIVGWAAGLGGSVAVNLDNSLFTAGTSNIVPAGIDFAGNVSGASGTFSGTVSGTTLALNSAGGGSITFPADASGKSFKIVNGSSGNYDGYQLIEINGTIVGSITSAGVLQWGNNPVSPVFQVGTSGLVIITGALSGSSTVSATGYLPATIYSAATTPLPACASAIRGERAVVSDATNPTYMGAYVSGGTITSEVICSYNGSTYGWLTK